MHCIDTKNHEGIRTIFTEEQRALKAKKHPELRQPDFVQRVKEAIERPDFIYRDLDKDDRAAYYCREFKVNNRVQYTKVMVRTDPACLFVITAYRPDYVEERGKTDPLYGDDKD